MPNEVSFERLNENKLPLHTRSLRSMHTLECAYLYLKQSRFQKGSISAGIVVLKANSQYFFLFLEGGIMSLKEMYPETSPIRVRG